MAKSHQSGSDGEAEVVQAVKCPNCGSSLMALPVSFPLFDVQCKRCLFRAQVKTARCPPKNEIFGAGWDILEKNRKAGHLIPPLIAHFHWKDKTGQARRKVYFFPFLTDDNIRLRTRSSNGKRPGYREFNYVGLLGENVPRMVLLEEP
jgi:hypothetical protein